MRFFRRMQNIPWIVKRTNESAMMEVNRNATLLNKMGTQQARFIGHVMRKHSLEHLVTTAKVEEKGARKDREKILDDITR